MFGPDSLLGIPGETGELRYIDVLAQCKVKAKEQPYTGSHANLLP